jgi:hypothetical protein
MSGLPSGPVGTSTPSSIRVLVTGVSFASPRASFYTGTVMTCSGGQWSAL